MKLLSILTAAGLSSAVMAAPPMFDPKIDNPEKSWSYGGKTTTVIGKPFVPKPIQITYDGTIFTGQAELAFFTGADLKPVMARQKNFRDGWMPIVEFDWQEDGLDYRLEIFSTDLPGLGLNNLVQFARLKMTNTGNQTVVGQIAAGVRTCGLDYRKGNPQIVGKNTVFDMESGAVSRDGKLLYSFPANGEKRVVPGVPYTAKYPAAKYHLTDRTATGFTIFKRELKAGESFQAAFKIPRLPVDNPEQVKTIRDADYDSNLQATIAYWEKLFAHSEITIPEKRVNDSLRGSLVHLLLATRGTEPGNYRQGSGLPYDALFLNDYMDMLLAYDRNGLFKFAEPNVDWLMRKQHKSGMFIDVHNRGNDNIVTSHGQGVFALAYHYVITRDQAYGEKVYDSVKRGVELISRDHYSDKHHGLLRPSIPYDAPMVTGYHTCHNLFGLSALRVSIRMAKMMGKDDDVKAWTKLEATYSQSILKAFDHAIAQSGYITSGLYDWSAGWVQGKKGRPNHHANQDWENNLLAYPTELLAPKDPRLTNTLATIRANKYREGVMTYRNGMHIHQYVTINQAHQYLVAGDQKHALLDLYHVLLHNGPTHEGFENLVTPWSNRTPSAGCPPPHAWAAAKIALFIRNMTVLEFGGKLGMNPEERDLHLYSLISPDWTDAGKKITIRDAVTEMGTVSSEMTFLKDGAEITFEGTFHTKPRYYAIRVPYFVKLKSFSSDAAKAFEKEGVLYFSPDARTATVKWEPIPEAHAGNMQYILKGYRSEYDFSNQGFRTTIADYTPENANKPFLLDDEKNFPATPLSFALIRQAFSKEYKRRFDEYVKEGGEPWPIAPPALLTADERAEQYLGIFDAMSLTVGKPAIASVNEGKAHFVNNGKRVRSRHERKYSWEAKGPAWWQVDFERDEEINKVVVACDTWSGSPQAYQFKVEYSLEGGIWSTVVDMSKNTEPMVKKGYTFEFKPIKMKFLRVTMLGNSKSKSVVLSEVMAFSAKKSDKK